MAKINFLLRQNSRAVVATLAFVAFVLILTLDAVQRSSTGAGVTSSLRNIGARNYDRFGGAVRKGYFHPDKAVIDDHTFRFAAVTDLDQFSRVTESKKPLFKSHLLPGILKTGTVYEILNKKAGTESFVVPRFVVTEGSGDTDKGMKWEWATIKNGELYLGSMGKEYTNPDGSIANTNNLWISILSPRGELRRVDWSEKYNIVRKASWLFLPRRISAEAYDENTDERKGSNKLVLIDDKFTTPEVVEIKIKDFDPLHGFSTVAFVPGSKDRHALAIRSVEEDCVGAEDTCKQRSYFIVIDVLTGDVLMDEVKSPDDGLKFEGVEFVDIYTPEKT
ncbi:Apyrase [Fragilaria crotonensis]|nr:Apyrase [Fragilaria crotonensis]